MGCRKLAAERPCVGPPAFIPGDVKCGMRPLNEYTTSDWRRLRPVGHWLKTQRYRMQREGYVRRPARVALTNMSSMRGRRVIATIAFEDPEAVSIQARLLARFVPDAVYLVADMSVDHQSAEEIRSTAEKLNVPYVRLPTSPLRRREHASRIHGLALNWTWRNIIRPAQPEAFGFIDHDIYPTKPDDPFSKLQSQPIYGSLRVVGGRWFLWAGFAMFRFAFVKDLPLDFGQDWFNGLDTGGANWNVLFRDLDRTRLHFAHTHFQPFLPGADPQAGQIQWCDTWLHEVGLARREGYADVAAEKRNMIKQLLAPHLSP